MGVVVRAPALDPHAGPAPATRFLSNGVYHVAITAAGSGGSWYGEHALSHWAGDPVEDADGFFLYLRSPESGEFRSLGHQPVRRPAERYEASWVPGRFRLDREDNGLLARLDVAVAADAALEVRRLELTNRGRESCRVELTSYVEVVLATARAHAAHPAFSKLFVQTEYVAEHGALLARRRPRARGENHPWLVHSLCGAVATEYETDRTRFLGRGGSVACPAVLRDGLALSLTTGNVLDPIASLRCTVSLAPGESRGLAFVLGVGEDREAALSLGARHENLAAVDKLLSGAESAARASLARHGLDASSGAYAHALAGAVLYGGLRAADEVRRRARGSRDGLARLGLLHKRPTVVVHGKDEALRRACTNMHGVWRDLGLDIDMVILGGEAVERRGADPPGVPRPWVGELRHIATGDLSADEMHLLEARARLVVREMLPELDAQGQRPEPTAFAAPHPRPSVRASPHPEAVSRREALECANGCGGFARGGGEYVLHLRGEAGLLHGLPPQPWINIIANERFGCLVSESGARHTWSENSREHRLTPWGNDPLLDPHGEALYLRDEDTGEFWSVLPGPAPGEGDYEVRHGFGYSVFRHESHALRQETEICVPRHDPVQIVVVQLANASARERHLSLTVFQRLLLGEFADDATIVTEADAESGALFACNVAAADFAGAIAFASTAGASAQVTTDRAAFLGRNGTMSRPAALCSPAPFDGRTGSGVERCFVQRAHVVLPAAANLSLVFLFGAGRDRDEARSLVAKYGSLEAARAARREVEAFWREGTGRLQISTPSRALDLLVNGWLPYQTLACRIWARTALYQSGGAFGYRDQLQDAASLALLWPELTRRQILLHGAHQFVEGDVLHWWHPPSDRGLRTRFADDLLWLPYLTAHYVEVTGDRKILDELLPYLEARPLAEGEDEAYLEPRRASSSGTLYEHCCRAIDRSLGRGAHGLPLFGTGDWNDGMNRVGREGRGESVWMGFFLHAVLAAFEPLCAARGDGEREQRYRRQREELRPALETAGWDGDWYRRGYYDDGTPLGSKESDECRIDALVQAWAVLSRAAPRERAARALQAVEAELVSEREGLIRLLSPPFEHTTHDPGYIKGYVRGVRENGGQYTHAALWVVRALAELGRNDRVARLLEMLSPMHHARDAASVAVYRVEPYVVAADVYGAAPHVGRGGWTWYTGSSGWMYRVILESLLGFRVREGTQLELAPCVPDDWPEFTIQYQLPGETTRYTIMARNPHRRGLGVGSGQCDGAPATVTAGMMRVPLVHDGGEHRVEVVLGKRDGGGE